MNVDVLNRSGRVWTRRGWILASDASHFYANMEEGRAFPIMHSHEDTLAGYENGWVSPLRGDWSFAISGHAASPNA